MFRFCPLESLSDVLFPSNELGAEPSALYEVLEYSFVRDGLFS